MRFTCLPLLSTFKRARNSSVLLSEKLSWAAWRLSLHSGTHTKRNCLVQSACWCTALQHGHIAGDTQLTATNISGLLSARSLIPMGSLYVGMSTDMFETKSFYDFSCKLQSNREGWCSCASSQGQLKTKGSHWCSCANEIPGRRKLQSILHGIQMSQIFLARFIGTT